MKNALRIPYTLCFVDMEDDHGYVLYSPAHDHYAGDGLPCSASILMVL
jgi:hypothetical protein